MESVAQTNLPRTSFVATDSVACLDNPPGEPRRRHIVYDAANQRVYVANAAMNRVDVLAVSNPRRWPQWMQLVLRSLYVCFRMPVRRPAITSLGYGFGSVAGNVSVSVGGQSATVLSVDALPTFASALGLDSAAFLAQQTLTFVFTFHRRQGW